MPVKMKPTSVIIADLGLEPNGKVHSFFTNTCALHMDKYVPWDTGSLAETVVVNGKVNTENVTTDTIVYNQNYAKYVYYGERGGKKLNYQTDVHPQAGPYWDKRMWSAERDIVVQEVQDYINTHGGK